MSEIGDQPAPAGRQAGYTLIEALVALTITTAVALIGFPKMQQGLLTLAQRQTTAVIAAKLREARAQALLRDAPVVLTIKPGGDGFDLDGATAMRTPAGLSLGARDAPGGRIAFYGDGTSSGGAFTVRAAGRLSEVRVTSTTGAVAMFRQ